MFQLLLSIDRLGKYSSSKKVFRTGRGLVTLLSKVALCLRHAFRAPFYAN